MDTQAFLREITHSRHYREQAVHTEILPPRPPRHADPATPIAGPVADALRQQGIERLYTHQAQALDAVRRGENVVVVTGTASGKTLCYNIPVLESLIENPAARALYLFPTKALAQDQLGGFRRLARAVHGLVAPAGCYDGDTPTTERKTIRDKGRVVLTNPDMLHSGILPNHSRWAEYLQNLRYVVIDEVHSYRGLFGANVANVLRRLRRICRHYGADPQFIFCSATIGNPDELCENLSDLPVTPVVDDGSPRGEKTFVLWNPPHLDDAKVERRSPSTEAHYLMTDLVRDSCQTICFVRARVTAELLYRMVQDRLRKDGSRLANAVRAYRGGYIAEDRREIERQLFSGELLGVATTNALELGIDIGSMEACLLVGYPGSIASLWQQAGRAGRGSESALAILIAQNDPIDQFLMRHPEFVFGRSPEHAVVDALNPHVQALHLRCAAKELPLSALDEGHYGEYLYAILELLEERGDLRRRGDRWFWAKPNVYPAAEFSLRLGTDNVYQIIDMTGPEPNVIGQLDELSAFHQLHTQAIYLHQAETYFVRELNVERKHAYVERGDFDYYTQAVAKAQIKIDDVERESPWRVSQTGVGDVTVTELVVMFRKIKFGSKDSIGFGNLDLPPCPLETTGMWLAPPRQALDLVRSSGRAPQDGLLGVANVLSGVMPLFTMCDRQDIGTTIDSSNLGSPTVFIYDKYPGGAGFSHRSFDRIEELMVACLELVSGCECEDGCPSCVGAPEPAGGLGEGLSRSAVPDKEATLCLLHSLLEREAYVPKPLGIPRPGTMPPDGDAIVMEPAVPPPPPKVKRLPEAVESKIRRRLQGLKL